MGSALQVSHNPHSSTWWRRSKLAPGRALWGVHAEGQKEDPFGYIEECLIEMGGLECEVLTMLGITEHGVESIGVLLEGEGEGEQPFCSISQRNRWMSNHLLDFKKNLVVDLMEYHPSMKFRKKPSWNQFESTMILRLQPSQRSRIFGQLAHGLVSLSLVESRGFLGGLEKPMSKAYAELQWRLPTENIYKLHIKQNQPMLQADSRAAGRGCCTNLLIYHTVIGVRIA